MLKKFFISAVASTLVLTACSEDSPKSSPTRSPVKNNCKPTNSRMARVTSSQYEFDVVIRDFEVTHPDFENFQEEAYYSLYSGERGANPDSWMMGYADNSNWMARRQDYADFGCGNAQSPQYGIAIGVQGYPHDLASATGAMSTVPDYVAAVTDPSGYAWYGEFSNCTYDPVLNPLSLKVTRGLVSDLCSDVSGSWGATMADNQKTCSKVCKTHNWSQIVYTTPGMVQQKLFFPLDETGALDMYEPVITRNRFACDNQYFEEWYADVPGHNLRTNTTLTLDQDPAAPAYFEIDKNWNNGGYFPLDSIDETGTDFLWAGPKLAFPNQYGAQSLSIFCPPYEYRYASTQTDFKGDGTAALCNAWKGNGGPRAPGAALAAAAANGTLGLRHLRNYNFTMMGYAAFKYKKGAGEVFKITGNNDVWVFVDGVLAADAGGVHLDAPVTVDMDHLAANAHGCYPGDPLADSCAVKLDAGTWADGSWHHLHFFYANRQTDGSTLKIRSSLSELANSRYNEPPIKSALAVSDKKGTGTIKIATNSPLDPYTIVQINANTDAVKAAEKDAVGGKVTNLPPNPTMLVKREVSVKDPQTGGGITKMTVVYGYYVASIEGPQNMGSEGQLYTFKGVLLAPDGTIMEAGILGGDGLAFNYVYNQDSYLGDVDKYKADPVYSDLVEQAKLWSTLLSFPIKASSGKDVTGLPETLEDWVIVKSHGTVDENGPSNGGSPNYDEECEE